jgi:beta-galactosidase
MWRVVYEPGTLKAVSRRNGRVVLTSVIKTAGQPAAILLHADRTTINITDDDLSFVTATIVDAAGNPVPGATNQIRVSTRGAGTVVATDNGSETSMESFKSPDRHAFHGLCLAVVQTNGKSGNIKLIATAVGLPAASLTITAK